MEKKDIKIICIPDRKDIADSIALANFDMVPLVNIINTFNTRLTNMPITKHTIEKLNVLRKSFPMESVLLEKISIVFSVSV